MRLILGVKTEVPEDRLGEGAASVLCKTQVFEVCEPDSDYVLPWVTESDLASHKADRGVGPEMELRFLGP